uniref:Methyltransferase n=1 Tax=Panagrellus redivivus TaxID=6233 RepID=A0A7E4VZD3_PANRE
MEGIWKHVWPCSEYLGSYLNGNPEIVKNKKCLELGAGATAILSIIALQNGAKSVVITDKYGPDDTPERQRIPALQRDNIKLNCKPDQVDRACFEPLNWADLATTKRVLTTHCNGGLDVVLGADVFYDPSVFIVLLDTVKAILDVFPKAEFYFAYQNRKPQPDDSNPTVAPL